MVKECGGTVMVEQCGGTGEQCCATVLCNSVVVQWNSDGGTVWWNTVTVWWNSGTVMEEECWWNSVVEQ